MGFFLPFQSRPSYENHVFFLIHAKTSGNRSALVHIYIARAVMMEYEI